jgi:hypothetical protein
MDGISDKLENGSRSGSLLLLTSMDILRSACKLLNSSAMSPGLSILVNGNWLPDSSACCISRSEGERGDICDPDPGDMGLLSRELLLWLGMRAGKV